MELRGTTILAVRNEHGVAIGGDGQVTMGQSMVMKHTARKVRRLYRGQVVAGFAGATADAFTLFERFEAKLEESGGNLLRAAVEMAKDWRQDKFLRKLEALLIVADRYAHPHRYRRCHRARRRRGGHRFRRCLRPCRSPRTRQAYEHGPGRDRARGHGPCRRHLRLYQLPPYS